MASSMEELQRAAVQLWEAQRLADHEDVPHVRLALLLLDNAAETSLLRSAQRGLLLADWYSDMAYRLRDVASDQPEGQRLKSEIDGKTLSKRRRRKIAHDFAGLADYVFEQEDFDLPAEFAECLKILHRYRNAAYHRDIVRSDVLGPAVQIYFFLCCHLLKHERHIMYQIDTIPPLILEMFGDRGPAGTWPGGSISSQGLGNDLADFFLEARGLDHAGIASALSSHLLGRLATLERHLATIGASVPPGINRYAVLQLVQQAPVEREDFDKEMPEDFWTRPVPVTESVLTEWERAADDLSSLPLALDALGLFAQIDQPLEELEEPVGRFIDDIDRAEQQPFDELRER